MEEICRIFQIEDPVVYSLFDTLCQRLAREELLSRRHLPTPVETERHFAEMLEYTDYPLHLDTLCYCYWNNGQIESLLVEEGQMREVVHAYYIHYSSVVTAVNLCLTCDLRQGECESSPLTRRERHDRLIQTLRLSLPALVTATDVYSLLDSYPLAITLPVFDEDWIGTLEAMRTVACYRSFTNRFLRGTRSIGELFEKWVTDRLAQYLPPDYQLEIPLSSPGTQSLPDAIVVTPDGRRMVIEVKSGATAALKQLQKHRAHGDTVFLLSRYGGTIPQISGPRGSTLPEDVVYLNGLFTIPSSRTV